MANDRLDQFSKAYTGMVAKSKESWNQYKTIFNTYRPVKQYSPEEVKNIIDGNNVNEQIALSRNYFQKDGIYQDLVIYYATLLKYVGILIPNPSYGTSLSNPSIKKKYVRALDYVESLHIPEMLTRFSIRILTDGYYYGIIQKLEKDGLTILDLPTEYCRSNFRDVNGNDIIEFNVAYFDSIINKESKAKALSTYPEIVSRYYSEWKNGKKSISWIMLPTEMSFCFSIFDNGRPFFLKAIPSCIHYEEAVALERERDLEEIRKIIVQKIPHLTSDGTLVFEPDEAEEMHRGAVNMMQGNKNISILTTYADVEAIVSKTSSDSVNNTLDNALQNTYAHAGVAKEIFAPTGSQALPTSIKFDTSLMMILGNKYSRFISYILNSLFENTNVNFKYSILPVSYYNDSDFITDALKLADKGFSFLLPCVAMGISQRDLSNLKDLENDVLDLQNKLMPLRSSYTESSESQSVGRPSLNLEDKSPKTIQNEDSLNKGGS